MSVSLGGEDEPAMTVLFTMKEILPEEFCCFLHRSETCLIVYPSCKGSRREMSRFTSLLVPQTKLNLYSKKNGEIIF